MHLFFEKIASLFSPARARVDPRRFWRGEVIPSPPGNAPLFKRISTTVITFEKESRDCIALSPGAAYEIEKGGTSGCDLYLSVATSFATGETQGVEVETDQMGARKLSALTADRWHHMKVPLPSGDKTITVRNTSSSTIFAAHPLFISPVTKSARAPRNIIVLLLDSLTHESLGEWTPFISRFFSSAHVYENAFAQCEWTYPSIYSLLMSRYPVDHGMADLKYFDDRGPWPVDCFPERLQKAGYLTMAYSTVKVFHPAFHGNRGFDRFFFDPFPQPYQTHRNLVDQAITQLEVNRGRNFIFLHFLDSHEPWTNPVEREEVSLSCARMTDPMKEYLSLMKGSGDTKAEPIFSDSAIARLTLRRNARLKEMDFSLEILFHYLETSQQHDETAVVLLSDHGFAHLGRSGPLLTDSRVHVPLLIRLPGESSRTQHRELVALNLDLGPTLLALAGAAPHMPEGKPISPFGNNQREYVISESIFGTNYKAAVRNSELVYHFCCAFAPDTQTICLKRARPPLLFERAHETTLKNLVSEKRSEANLLHGILMNHLNRFPNKLCSQNCSHS